MVVEILNIDLNIYKHGTGIGKILYYTEGKFVYFFEMSTVTL